jgi:hypothetical protein
MTASDIARQLPGISVLREHCRAMAMLEAILSPDWSARHHGFNAHWSKADELASMSNGSGDEYSIVFSSAGAYIRGFAHESPMSPYVDDEPWPGVIDDVPENFRPYVEEPAFSDEDGMAVVTACLWRGNGDDSWATGTIAFPGDGEGDPDGAGYLFRLLVDRSPEAFQEFAEDYYEIPVDQAAVRYLFAHGPVTDEVVTVLNPQCTMAELTKDFAEIGYPRG